MIAIKDILISDSVAEDMFVCDLASCKGRCCEDGDTGAPLEIEELSVLKEIFPTVKPYLTPMGLKIIEKEGLYVSDPDYGWVTPALNKGICAYGFKAKDGLIQCAIEQAYNDKKINWKKPISCHLFPIRVRGSNHEKISEYWNYEPRSDLCKAACTSGKKLKVPVYVFLKEPIIRKCGAGFYETLEKEAQKF